MTMLEKMARAHCLHGEATCWETHISEMRRVLEAMREPTKAMCDAAIGSGALHSDDLHSPEPAMVWQAMIDAALEDKVVASRGEA